MENERALREIERRREKEKGQPDPFDGEISGRHRREKRSHRDRDREQRGGERERARRQALPTTPPEEHVEEEIVEAVDPRIQLEVQVRSTHRAMINLNATTNYLKSSSCGILWIVCIIFIF